MPTAADKLICGICGSDNVARHMDVGWDVDESGEERQHIDICLSCGAESFWVDRLINFLYPRKIFGNWIARKSNEQKLPNFPII